MFATVILLSIVGRVAQSSHGVASGFHDGGPGYGLAVYDGPRYHGPLAIPVVLPDGYIADTPEVAAAKNAHLIAVSKAAELNGYEKYEDDSYNHGSYSGAGYVGTGYGGPKYHGPLAIPIVLPDGHIADTPEVAAAKEAHLVAVSKAAELSGYGDYDDGSYGHEVSTETYSEPGHAENNGEDDHAGTHGGQSGIHSGPGQTPPQEGAGQSVTWKG